MTDLSRLIADLCVGLEDPETGSLSGFPERVSGSGFLQVFDKTESFRSFQHFRSENSTLIENDVGSSKNENFGAAGSRVTSSYVGSSERPETPESVGVSSLETTLSLFPVKESVPERPETEGFVAGMFSPSDDPLPISSADVRTGVDRELRALAVLGRTGPEAERDAVEITRAKIRNSPTLIERQPANGRCHVCQEVLDDSRPEIAILQPKPGEALHMHSHCHAGHMARRSNLVDRIMVAAGFATTPTTGSAPFSQPHAPGDPS